MIELKIILQLLLILQYLSNNSYIAILNLFLLFLSESLDKVSLFLFISILQESVKFNKFIELLLFDILFYLFCTNKFIQIFIMFLHIMTGLDLLYYLLIRYSYRR
jgi:hypothetical protein